MRSGCAPPFAALQRSRRGIALTQRDVATINSYASDDPPALVLRLDGSVTRGATEPVRAGLAAIARDAIETIARHAAKLRACEGTRLRPHVSRSLACERPSLVFDAALRQPRQGGGVSQPARLASHPERSSRSERSRRTISEPRVYPDARGRLDEERRHGRREPRASRADFSHGGAKSSVPAHGVKRAAPASMRRVSWCAGPSTARLRRSAQDDNRCASSDQDDTGRLRFSTTRLTIAIALSAFGKPTYGISVITASTISASLSPTLNAPWTCVSSWGRSRPWWQATRSRPVRAVARRPRARRSRRRQTRPNSARNRARSIRNRATNCRQLLSPSIRRSSRSPRWRGVSSGDATNRVAIRSAPLSTMRSCSTACWPA